MTFSLLLPSLSILMPIQKLHSFILLYVISHTIIGSSEVHSSNLRLPIILLMLLFPVTLTGRITLFFILNMLLRVMSSDVPSKLFLCNPSCFPYMIVSIAPRWRMVLTSGVVSLTQFLNRLYQLLFALLTLRLSHSF